MSAEGGTEVLLTVRAAEKRDAGRGVARVPESARRDLGVLSGDTVLVEGSRRTVLKVWPADADVPDDLFESVDVDAVDDEAVWESFVEGETGPEEQVGLGAEAEAAPEPHEHVVPKRDFCQRCPHFSAPPETACSHGGTTIVEVVDADHFRVRNCPIVEDEDAASPFD